MYALGRPVEATDMPEVRRLVQQSAEQGYRFSSLIKGIIGSQSFRYASVPGGRDGHNLVAEN